LFVVGASDPIEDAPVLSAEVYSPFEHHDLADLPAFHLDRVFVGASAIAFKYRLPDIVLTFDLGVEFLADVLGRGCALRRIVNAPRSGPCASNVRGLIFSLGSLRVLGLGKGDTDARDQHQNEQGEATAICHGLLLYRVWTLYRLRAVGKRSFED